jgi:hypothetical protein
MQEENKNGQNDQGDQCAPVPFIAHRQIVAAQERHVGRLIYTIIFIVALAILAMIGEAAIFVGFLNQYEFVSEAVTVDGQDGVANFVGGNGDITNNGQYPAENSESY